MQLSDYPVIYTIGHSTHTIEEFINMLRIFDIQVLADVRRFPGSKKYPWFNKESLEKELQKTGIEYIHFEDLGGRRKVQPGSHNDRWKNDSFRGYADYMETENFETSVKRLESIARKKRTVYMCSEAVWWSCHRSMISDYLKAGGWKVLHIMSPKKTEEHPYTSPARVLNGHVYYSDENLFNQDKF